MAITIYSAPGCLRCKIVKRFIKDSGRTYRDCDALGEGRETFRTFYRNNRQLIHRGPDGVEFPIFCRDEIIRQGLASIMADLIAGPVLDGFFKPGWRHGQWVDGIHVSGGDPSHADEFLDVLNFLKNQRLKLQVETNGVNPGLLKEVLARDLADRVIMEVKGPLDLYQTILQCDVDHEEIKESIARVSRCKDYHFYTEIRPIDRGNSNAGPLSYLTPEEIAETAQLIKTAAGDSRQPYRISAFDPRGTADGRLRQCEALAPNALFKYRTLARKHQYRTEIVSAPG